MECPICKSQANMYNSNIDPDPFYVCPTCGRFELIDNSPHINGNHLAAFLFYKRFLHPEEQESWFHTMKSKEWCDTYKEGLDQYNRPVHFDSDIVENWYPKTFAERVDYILLKLNEMTPHIGSIITLSKNELLSLLFVDRHESSQLNTEIPKWREEQDCLIEANYMLSYLQESRFIDYSCHDQDDSFITIYLHPEGYSKIDGLLKTSAKGNNALCAMKFSDETIPLREAIRKGISNAGFNAIFIDEVQHNDFITPELLKYIRDSKFVVVDLTHKNNGAYFEEGYAMGLGKPVIQLCRKNKKLHFDIAQKNTIIWETEEDIPLKLENRIRATID